MIEVISYKYEKMWSYYIDGNLPRNVGGFITAEVRDYKYKYIKWAEICFDYDGYSCEDAKFMIINGFMPVESIQEKVNKLINNEKS